MKKLLFLTKYRKENSWEENRINLLLRCMFRAGFKANNLPKKYQYLEKEVLHD